MGKLIKYEIKSTGKITGLVLLATVITNFICAGIFFLDIPALSAIALGLTAFVNFAMLIGISIYLLVAYYQSMYGRAGYLTNTLPISGGKIYFAKIIWMSLVTLATYLVLVLNIFVLISMVVTDSKAIIRKIGAAINSYPTSSLVFITAAFLLFGVIQSVISGVFSITIGCSRRLSHLGKGGIVLGFVITYFLTQIVSLLGVACIPGFIDLKSGQWTFGWNKLADMFSLATTTDDINTETPIGFIVTMLIMVIALIWVSYDQAKNHISLR